MSATVSTMPSIASGIEMMELMHRLYPICRSLTGDGVRQSLAVLKEYVPLDIQEIPTGTQVFDWTVPKEWNIKDAYIRDSRGRKVVDFKQSNLHVLGYSIPVHRTMHLSELKTHLYTSPEYPDAIPYRTSYYEENWGFCLTHNQLTALPDEEYDVCIDSSLEDGDLTYGEYFVQGEIDSEILISTHMCHPSLANDNLSGIAVATALATHVRKLSPRYSYRFLFTPGLIGSITWLALNEKHADRIKHGLVVTCLGDSGPITYKKSRRGDAEIDRVTQYVLRENGDAHSILEFSPWGYDERQFCSPGFNLPVGCFMRTPHGEFAQYHTSADDLEFVRSEYLDHSFKTIREIFEVLESNQTYWNTNPKCEPQLGRRGLYTAIGGGSESKSLQIAMLLVLNFSDGNCSLLDIAERSGLKFDLIKTAADALRAHGLLRFA